MFNVLKFLPAHKLTERAYDPAYNKTHYKAHYENTPIQIYRKVYHQKLKIFR